MRDGKKPAHAEEPEPRELRRGEGFEGDRMRPGTKRGPRRAPGTTLEARTSVLIPAYQEGSSIAGIVESVRRAGPFREILVVDDGSTDETAERARGAGAEVIRHPYNKGNGAAVKTAIRAARGEYVLLLDADGQHPPEEIAKLLEKLPEFDLVVGARPFRTQATLARALGNSALNRFASVIAGFRIADLTSGFRAARRDRLKEFLHLYPNGFSYPATSTLAFIKAGYNVAFVPIDGKRRGKDSKSKMRPWKEGWRFLAIVLRTTTLFSPLKVFLPVVAVVFLVGLAYTVYTVATKTDVTDTSVLLFTLSAILFLFGLISEQIAALRFRPRDDD